MRSRCQTFDQQQFHYDLSKDDTLYPSTTPAMSHVYRPQGANVYRIRNEIKRDQRGPGNIHVQTGINDRLFCVLANDETATVRMITLPAGEYSFRTFAVQIQQLLSHLPFPCSLKLQYHAELNRISVYSTIQWSAITNSWTSDQFVINAESESLWVSLGFEPLTPPDTQRSIPSPALISSLTSSWPQDGSGLPMGINTYGTIAPSLLGSTSGEATGPIQFHKIRNPAFQSNEVLDASTNTFRRRYNNIQKAAPSYVSSYGLATATSLVYQKSIGGDAVLTKKDYHAKPACHLECLLR